MRKDFDERELAEMLRGKGVSPTTQRLKVLGVLQRRYEHLSAEEIFKGVNEGSPMVSKATVYNTLALFVERGLVRQVIADPERIYYDPNTEPHHHIFNTTTGRLMDIQLGNVQIQGLPELDKGMYVEGVDVIVRVRSDRQENNQDL